MSAIRATFAQQQQQQLDELKEKVAIIQDELARGGLTAIRVAAANSPKSLPALGAAVRAVQCTLVRAELIAEAAKELGSHQEASSYEKFYWAEDHTLWKTNPAMLKLMVGGDTAAWEEVLTAIITKKRLKAIKNVVQALADGMAPPAQQQTSIMSAKRLSSATAATTPATPQAPHTSSSATSTTKKKIAVAPVIEGDDSSNNSDDEEDRTEEKVDDADDGDEDDEVDDEPAPPAKKQRKAVKVEKEQLTIYLCQNRACKKVGKLVSATACPICNTAAKQIHLN